jgi:hypothetical protein
MGKTGIQKPYSPLSCHLFFFYRFPPRTEKSHCFLSCHLALSTEERERERERERESHPATQPFAKDHLVSVLGFLGRGLFVNSNGKRKFFFLKKKKNYLLEFPLNKFVSLLIFIVRRSI